MSAAANPGLFTLPTFTINNLFGVPILTNASGTPHRRLIPFGSVAVIFILDALFQDYVLGRSLADDQASVYRAAESRISASPGLDGRACVLRFICELRKNPIQEWTIVGELLTMLFTPRENGKGILKDYLQAIEVGDEEDPDSCYNAYAFKCPLSVFNYFRTLQEEEEEEEEELEEDEEEEEEEYDNYYRSFQEEEEEEEEEKLRILEEEEDIEEEEGEKEEEENLSRIHEEEEEEEEKKKEDEEEEEDLARIHKKDKAEEAEEEEMTY
ncbi:myb-like protein X [Eriocheir sinensis]|uniref:myb-like protein X n=1 Tax=Eriocheir sinensis TaxID=95602 RepID=UPI0021C9880A|nr:myb-like protein X [Eriocheir sinensis]